MVNCGSCGEKISLFQKKFDFEDENGNIIKYCEKCNKEYFKEEKRKKEKQIKNETKKKQELKEKQNTIRVKEILQFIKKYFSKCDTVKKVVIGRFYSEKEIYNTLEKDYLDFTRDHIVKNYSWVEEIINSGEYDDLDTYMKLKQMWEISFDFLTDFEKIYKVLNKKGLKTNYKELAKLFNKLFMELIEEENNQTVIPEYKRISNKIKKNRTIKKILYELIRTPLPTEIDEDIARKVLDKFKIKYSENELIRELNKLKEELDLEEFENNLNNKKKKSVQQQIGSYKLLNGHEFESYLKKVLETIGYVVVQTKLSGDQGADLITMKDGIKTAIQAKKYAGSVSNKAVQEVVAAKKHYKCEEAIVITTGKFTKSAIQLALSNDVELWDKTKLDSIISDINSNSSKQLISNQSKSFQKNEEDVFITINCPYCDTEFELPESEMPTLGNQGKKDCPSCGFELTLNIQKESYTCRGCSKKFKTIRNKRKHEEKCKEYSLTHHTCSDCESEFYLDKKELKELKSKKN